MSMPAVAVVERFLQTSPDRLTTVIHPDAVFVESGGVPFRGEWRGPQGVADLLGTVRGGLRLEFLDCELLPAGESRVLALMRLRFTSRATGQSSEMSICEVYDVRDDLIVGADIYYKDPATVERLHDPS